MDWIEYVSAFLAVCVIYFFITRVWVSGIDLMISGFKKIFGLNKNNGTGNWHTLEEIREKNEEDLSDK